MTTSRRVAIVSSVHWDGDPRLNRHRAYLTESGHEVSLISHRGVWRPQAVTRALADIVRSKSRVVILPDPELFFLGSLAARLTRSLPLVDIHEDYPQAAMTRSWVPEWARPMIRALAAGAVWLGRRVAWRVMVAAPELVREGDTLVVNVPDPASLQPLAHDGSHRLVYIGDVTLARGALAMVETLSHLDERFSLQLVGSVSSEIRDQIETLARRFGLSSRVEISGRVDHADAWERARGALVGLNLLSPAPAYMEAVATKLWEYMAIGLPPVVTALPGQARVISRVDAGLVCTNPEEAAAAIWRLSEDPGLRASLGDEFRRLVEETWEARRPDRELQSLLEP